jgi:hypothetical protein
MNGAEQARTRERERERGKVGREGMKKGRRETEERCQIRKARPGPPARPRSGRHGLGVSNTCRGWQKALRGHG